MKFTAFVALNQLQRIDFAKLNEIYTKSKIVLHLWYQRSVESIKRKCLNTMLNIFVMQKPVQITNPITNKTREKKSPHSHTTIENRI